MNLGCRTGSRSKIFLKQNDGLHNQQTLIKYFFIVFVLILVNNLVVINEKNE